VIELEKKESIYHLFMNAGENRWNTSFVRKFAEALDEIEKDEGPGALVTSSKYPKGILKVERERSLVKNSCT
jgi:enoyl-CoA hydratase/carnithine racemase